MNEMGIICALLAFVMILIGIIKGDIMLSLASLNWFIWVLISLK